MAGFHLQAHLFQLIDPILQILQQHDSVGKSPSIYGSEWD